MIAGAYASREAGASGATTTFAVIQSVAFVAMEAIDMYPSRSASGSVAAACCCPTIATIVVVALVAATE